MNWFSPIDPDDPINGTKRLKTDQVESQLNSLFANNENFQGLFPVYGDLSPCGQVRSSSTDRRRTWHGGYDLMMNLRRMRES